MENYFRNKVLVVTGGSSGIGKAIVLKALSEGANVAVCSRNIDTLTSAYSADLSNEKLLLYPADVSVEDDCKAFISVVIQKWKTIDILINNAGKSMRALFNDTHVKVLQELMDVNFWGTVFTTKAALPHLIQSNGSIVGVSSIAGYRGLPGRTGYSASKFAMQGFLEALRTEMIHTGVHVMWVAPGFTASNIRNVALAADGSQQKETPLDEQKLMTAEDCALLILKGIQKRKRTMVMTKQGKATVWLNKILPALMDKIVFNHFAKEQGSPLKK